MQDLVVELIKQANIVQLIAVGVMIWFFYNRLDKKIERSDRKIENIDATFGQKLEKLNKDLTEKIDKTTRDLTEKMDKTTKDLLEKIGAVDKKVDNVEKVFTERFNKVDRRIGKVKVRVEDIDRKLFEIEVDLKHGGSCALRQSNQETKAS